MDKPDTCTPVEDSIDHKIRMFRESSSLVSEAHIDDLLQRSDGQDPTAAICSRIQNTLSVSIGSP